MMQHLIHTEPSCKEEGKEVRKYNLQEIARQGTQMEVQLSCFATGATENSSAHASCRRGQWCAEMGFAW